jgi:HD-GYP domain-containing protein (c-di-GMP phosphodiesterase class II)
MMDTPEITCPAFLAMDRSIIDDFIHCTDESMLELEACIKLLNANADEDCVGRLFRALHSFKGNCHMVGLTPFVEPLHKLEELVSRVRTKEWTYHPMLGQFLVFSTDAMTDLLTQLVTSGHANGHTRKLICDVCSGLLASTQRDKLAQQCARAIVQLGKTPMSSVLEPLRPQKVSLQLPSDMELMHSLSARLDDLSIYRKNRGDQVVKLSAQLNAALGTPVNPEQLKAAALMHDIGMGFIPHTIFNREGGLSKEELRKLHEHVLTGSQIVKRFGNWDEAAQMILDHHERFDGTGYPNGTQGDSIHPGGHILSIIDTFCAITTERSDRAFKKSLLSAISEINANSETQFNPHMVKAFTAVVRTMMTGGA